LHISLLMLNIKDSKLFGNFIDYLFSIISISPSVNPYTEFTKLFIEVSQVRKS